MTVMAMLYGITPTGVVVTKKTRIAYKAGLVRGGALVRCFRTFEEARDKSHAGDVVIGFTSAPLRPGQRAYIAYWNGGITCHPACYVRNCTGAGGMVGEHWTGYGNETVPACQKHARKEVV